MHGTVLFSAVIALIVAAATNAAPTTSHAVADIRHAVADTRGWNAGVVEAREGVVEARADDAVLQAQLRDNAKLRQQISDVISQINQQLQTAPPGSDAANQLQSRLQQSQDTDKRLELESQRIEAQIQAAGNKTG